MSDRDRAAEPASEPGRPRQGPRAEGGAVDSAIATLPVRIERDELLHFLDYPPGHAVPERVERLIGAVLPEAQPLIDARGAYQRLAVSRAPAVGLEPVEATGLVVGLVTAGEPIEARVKALMETGDLSRAVLLDAAGSAAAEQAADRLGAVIAAGAEPGAGERATAIGCRLSPGYGRWKLEHQRELFALLPHAELGVSLTDSCMMVPRKSISFAMWLGAPGRPAAGLSGCSRCPLDRCRYRRAAADAEPSAPSPTTTLPTDSHRGETR